MSAAAETPFDAAAGDRLAKRNALVLATGQALAGANNTVIVATGGILGAMLAPDKSLATLPISMMVVGMWAGTLPVGFLARHFGRRTAYLAGAACGCLAGLVGFVAVMQGSFWIYLVSAFLGGLYAASHQSYRFGAADTASPAFKPKAVSWVMAGGLFAALLGPQLIIHTKDLMPPFLFAASYLGQAGFAVLAAVVLLLFRAPRGVALDAAAGGRPIGEIARQPRFVVAVVCGVASYALMNLMMTSAPLAMVDCGHSVADATLGIQWHVLAMYAPSFFTGTLILRFGVARVVAAGLGLIALAAVAGLSGLTVAHFWTALILLGVGWNFAFVGATTMVTDCHRPEERNKVQALNDFLIFGSMAIGSFASGTMLAFFGWALVNIVMFPGVAIAGVMLLWLGLRDRRRVA
ncbi:MAG: MFS transporter [Xanthobacteraceae bacterium]|nr:MFS transporter [Xanthobacteraceae bacterium]PWB57356.1 MAG: MFS transporter [Bradyrhizobiaceae bacterium]GIK80538.1 MAG: MFS transporter [Alphaproteobacteria bacterium]